MERILGKSLLGSSVKDTDGARKTFFKANPKVYKMYSKMLMVFRAMNILIDALFNQLSNNMEDWEQQVFLGSSKDILMKNEETMRTPIC